MEFLARKLSPNEVEKEVTQRDQFNTDTVGLVETLVREAHQNSMDGRALESSGPVRTVLRIVNCAEGDTAYWSELFGPLKPHLLACGIKLDGLDLSRPKLLLIEDFGTTGLLGSTMKRDQRNFSDFWRSVGRSHKSGQQGGRWGLGKLVFSSSSRIRTFFGVTVQLDDDRRTPLLMGQAVLKTHALPGSPEVEYDTHAFYAVAATDGLQLPERNPAVVDAFRKASGISRSHEPGLSIVIPFVHDDITTVHMLPLVIRNWFFPILTGNLEVDVGDVVLNRENFAEHARAHGGPEFADGRRVEFIRQLHARIGVPPSVVLGPQWTEGGKEAVETALSKEALDTIRASFSAGELVGVRAPIKIRRQNGQVEATHVDVYLKAIPEMDKGEAFFVRGTITIPGEAKRFTGRKCFGALIADHAHVAAFLGDAEGPAHTTWSGTAEKVRENWKNPSERLKEIREVLNWVFQAAANVADQMDPNALINVFNVPQSGEAPKPRRRRDPVVTNKPVGPIVRSPQQFKVEARKGGFTIRSTKETQSPLFLRVRTAYDVIDGNPLVQYSEFDFDLMKDDDIQISSSGVEVGKVAPNELRLEVTSSAFEVAVGGFDVNRDLFVSVERAQ